MNAPRFLPGQSTISAAEWNDWIDQVSRQLSALTSDLDYIRTAGGSHIAKSPSLDYWIKITGPCLGPVGDGIYKAGYPWEFALRVEDDVISLDEKSGTITAFPAVEMSGNQSVEPGTIVRAWANGNSSVPALEFASCCGSGGGGCGCGGGGDAACAITWRDLCASLDKQPASDFFGRPLPGYFMIRMGGNLALFNVYFWCGPGPEPAGGPNSYYPAGNTWGHEYPDGSGSNPCLWFVNGFTDGGGTGITPAPGGGPPSPIPPIPGNPPGPGGSHRICQCIQQGDGSWVRTCYWVTDQGIIIGIAPSDGVACPPTAIIPTTPTTPAPVLTPLLNYAISQAYATVTNATTAQDAYYADTGNSGTGETTIFSKPLDAAFFAADGDRFEAVYAGTESIPTISTLTIRIKVGGTTVYTTTITGAIWALHVIGIRSSASSIRCLIEGDIAGALQTPIIFDVTGLSLPGSVTVALTAQSSGSTNDIVGKIGAVTYYPRS